MRRGNPKGKRRTSPRGAWAVPLASPPFLSSPNPPPNIKIASLVRHAKEKEKEVDEERREEEGSKEE